MNYDPMNLRIDFLRKGDKILPSLSEGVLYLANGLACGLFHDTGMDRGPFIAGLSCTSNRMLKAEDYQSRLVAALDKVNDVRCSVHSAIIKALKDEGLCAAYANWERATLSDFAITCTINPDLTVDPKSYCLHMRYPETKQTSDLPFTDEFELPNELIKWLVSK